MYDGDEMNIFVPQSVQTAIELEMLANVQTQMIKTTTSSPIYGMVQDCLIGTYLITQPDCELDWRTCMNFAVSVKNRKMDDKMEFEKNKMYSGSQMFSQLLPNKLFLTKKTDTGMVTIKEGELLSGVINSNFIKAGKNGISRMILDEYDEKHAADFISDLSKLTCNFIMHAGYSVGIGDTDMPPDIYTKKREILKTKTILVQKILTEAENNPQMVSPALLEKAVFDEGESVLNDITIAITNAMKGKKNGIVTSINSGVGDEMKLAQISGFIGSTSIEHKRIRTVVNNRTLPYFFQHDDTVEARGMIKHSFIEGMAWPEFVYNLMSAREGLIDSTIKTADTGYMQRKLIKSMEDLSVKYDMTVRTSTGSIYQFTYGDSGLNTTKQYAYTFELLSMNNEMLKNKFSFDSSAKNLDKYDNAKFVDNMKSLRDRFRTIMTKTRFEFKTIENQIHIPMNILSIVSNELNNKFGSTQVTASYVIHKLKQILSPENTTAIAMNKSKMSDSTYIKCVDDKHSKLLFKAVLLTHLAPKRIIEEYKFSKEQFDKICDIVIANFKRSRVEPGEMIGIIAAQSFGEPLTQMSVTYDTTVVIYDAVTQQYQNVQIGKFIDDHLKNKSKQVVHLDEHSVVLDIPARYFVVGVNKNETVEWKPIEQISRHLANGLMLKITTENGKVVHATASHSFLTRDMTGIVPIEGSKLRVGDYIPIAKYVQLHEHNMPLIYAKLFGYFPMFGWFENNCVMYEMHSLDVDDLIDIVNEFNVLMPSSIVSIESVASFAVSKTIYHNGTNNKHTIIKIESKQLKQFIKTYFVNNRILMDILSLGNEFIYEIVTTIDNFVSIYPDLIDDISLLHSFSNVRCCTYADDIYYHCDKSRCADVIPNVDAHCRTSSRLELAEIVETMDSNESKTQSLIDAINGNIWWDRIVSIQTSYDYENYVYDLTVPGTDSFMVNDGILVHNTLKAFHFSGIAAMGTTNLGVPRIKELLNNSKNIKTPKMFIYLKDNVMRDKTIANTIANHLKYTKIVDLQTEIGVYYDPNPNDNSYMKHDGVSSTVFYSMSFNKMKYTQNYESLPWLLRIVFDREKLYTKEVTLLDIKTKFCNEWKKKILDNKFMNKDDRDLYDKIINISVLSTPEHGKNPIVHIRFNINNVNYEILNKFMTNCEEFRMKGLDELTEINVNYDENMVNYDPETGDTKMDKNNVLYSTGINMVDIRHIESININKTYCNDVMTIYELFGIEAARTVLKEQLYASLKSAGNNMIYHHIAILIDTMTNSGIIASIDRHGMNKLDFEPLASASFEKPVERFVNAAVFSERDSMTSCSARVMAGMPIGGGTGTCDLLFDIDMVEKTKEAKLQSQSNMIEIDATINKTTHKKAKIFIPE